jgi:uncharacterized repeat protein (TIGR01451 family)
MKSAPIFHNATVIRCALMRLIAMLSFKLTIPILAAFICAPAQAYTLGDDLLNYSVLGGGTYVTTEDSADIYGNVGALDTLNVGANATITGDGEAGGAGTIGDTGHIIDGSFLSGGANTLGANGVIDGDFLAGGALTASASSTVGGDSRAATQAELTAMTDRRVAAVNDLTSAKTYFDSLGAGTVLAATMTVDTALNAGVYSAASWSTTAGTTLTLNNQGLNDAIWVFNIADILALGGVSNIVISGSGLNSRVFWNTNGHASVGAGANFVGTILATNYISLGDGAVNLGTDSSSCGGLYSVTSYVTLGANAQVGSDGCGVSVSAVPPPDILVLKSVQVYSDPVNLQDNPKAIPGSVMFYTVMVTNRGGSTDTDTVVITDPMPVNTEVFVNDINGAGSGPLLFTDGNSVSGLSYSMNSLASTTDNISFSNDNGASFGYTPIPNVDGYDIAVTDIKVSLSGPFIASSGAPHPSFSIIFRVRVQ